MAQTKSGIFDALPIEIIGLITEFFDGITLCKFAGVCTQAKALSEHEKLWTTLIRRDYPHGVGVSGPPRESYLKRRKEKWEASQRLKHRKDNVTACLAAEIYKAGFWSKMKQKVGIFTVGTRHYKVIFCGLDAAGKTTFVYKLKMDPVTTIPTIGFNVETASLQNWDFTMWDVGGPDKIRPLWRHYYQDAVALIWMIDSNDRERVNESKEELFKTLFDNSFGSPYLLVYANKQDLPNAFSVAELASKMDLHSLPMEIKWNIQACCATSGDGLIEGLDWLGQCLLEHEKALSK